MERGGGAAPGGGGGRSGYTASAPLPPTLDGSAPDYLQYCAAVNYLATQIHICEGFFGGEGGQYCPWAPTLDPRLSIRGLWDIYVLWDIYGHRHRPYYGLYSTGIGMQWRAEVGGGGIWPPGASLGGGAGPACIGANFKSRDEFQRSMLWAPRSLCISRGLFFLFLAEDLFFYFFCLSIFSPGGYANSGGGGAPMQALAPGRWRPSARHCMLYYSLVPGTID